MAELYDKVESSNKASLRDNKCMTTLKDFAVRILYKKTKASELNISQEFQAAREKDEKLQCAKEAREKTYDDFVKDNPVDCVVLMMREIELRLSAVVLSDPVGREKNDQKARKEQLLTQHPAPFSPTEL